MASSDQQLQSAALPYRFMGPDEVEVLLVTSRRSGRWVLPKGKVKKGLLPSASAAREAFEEAGVIGQIEHQSFSSYRQARAVGRETPNVVVIAAFALAVSSEVPVWPEMHQRQRAWASLSEAHAMVRDRELSRVLDAFATRLSS